MKALVVALAVSELRGEQVSTRRGAQVADIVAVPGNVLSDIHATERPIFVMHLGHVVVQKTGT